MGNSIEKVLKGVEDMFKGPETQVPVSVSVPVASATDPVIILQVDSQLPQQSQQQSQQSQVPASDPKPQQPLVVIADPKSLTESKSSIDKVDPKPVDTIEDAKQIEKIEVKKNEVKDIVEPKPMDKSNQSKPLEQNSAQNQEIIALEPLNARREPEFPYAAQLLQLQEMGFTDIAQLKDYLLATKGDANRVVPMILSNMS